MLDIHTHILPGMDDGSQSPEQSAAMLQTEAEQGVHTVVLTPHYDPARETPAVFLQRRTAAETSLFEAIRTSRGLPRLLSGAEVAFFEGISRVEDLQPLCIGRTRFMLIEMPFYPWNRHILGELDALQQMRDIRPVLAHVERYRSFQPAGQWKELKEHGFLLQCNASFFLRWQTSRRALAMLKEGLVHFIASDCHNLENRPPNLANAMERIERKLGAPALEFLEEAEEWLLEG